MKCHLMSSCATTSATHWSFRRHTLDGCPACKALRHNVSKGATFVWTSYFCGVGSSPTPTTIKLESSACHNYSTSGKEKGYLFPSILVLKHIVFGTTSAFPYLQEEIPWSPDCMGKGSQVRLFLKDPHHIFGAFH